MFDFFKMFFGGVYYAGKMANEKAKDNDYRKKVENRQSLYNRLSSQISATEQFCGIVRNQISSGNHYDEICCKFESDFEFVLGLRWKDKLKIPPLVSHNKNSFLSPVYHSYWVYHLMLASQGKVDRWILNMGYSIGGKADAEMNIKFAQCIEKHLQKSGITDVKFGLELDDYGGRKRNNNEPYGGKIKIIGLANYPTYRLWKND